MQLFPLVLLNKLFRRNLTERIPEKAKENILGFYKAIWLKTAILFSEDFVKFNCFQNNLGIYTIIGY